MSERSEYQALISINGRSLSRVIIDQHYRVKHPEIDDQLILELVKEIDGGVFDIEMEKKWF